MSISPPSLSILILARQGEKNTMSNRDAAITSRYVTKEYAKHDQTKTMTTQIPYLPATMYLLAC